MNCPQCNTANPDFAASCRRCGIPLPVVDSETVEVLDTAALSPGSNFGARYRIESLLGEGGMGRVYKAYDKDIDRIVAIKVVRPGMMGEAEALKRFKQELLLASRISQKNVLRVHDMGEVGNVKFISMAYVEGQDLHQILQETPKLPLERVLSFARQLAEALAAAHAEGVVHRDLKPQNILVAKDDHIYVSDFGLARSLEEISLGMTRTGAFLGTPRYMCPEQVEGKTTDQRSDLYSYGLILYEMVTGNVPFTGESELKVMYQRIQEKPKDPKLANPSLPGWFNQIILRCLERNPNARYQSAYEILADLQGPKPSTVTQTVQIPISEFTESGWIWVLASVAVLLILAFALPPVRHLIWGTGGRKGSSHTLGIPSLEEGKFVAVLPFRMLGDAQSLGYVADGLNEALSSKLFQLKDLRLASNTSGAKTSAKDSLDKTARALGVNLIVEGTIQGSADKMAIIVNLHDVADGNILWSDTFDANVKDLLTLEDKIYTALASALSLKPTNEELARSTGRPTENIEAYDFYLKGRNVMRGQQGPMNIQAAIDYFKEALNKDSSFALAYAGLADASLLMYGEKKDSFWSQKALGAGQQAERLNNNLPEVHFSLGAVYDATGQAAEAIAQLKRALDLAPNSDEAYRRLGAAYEKSGHASEAIKAYQRAIEVNPYYWLNQSYLGVAYTNFGDYEKALKLFDQVIQLEPDNSAGYDNKGSVYFREGKFNDCIPYFQKALQLQPYWGTYSNLGTAYFYLKRYPEAVERFEKAVEMNPNQESMLGNLADGYRWAGEKNKALATYEKAISLTYKELQVNPRDAAALADLALYYGKKGDVSQARQFIRRARAIDQADLYFIYVEAVVNTLSNQLAYAVRDLRTAFQKGYSLEDVKMDPEFGPLQLRPDFQSLLKEFGGKSR